MKINYQEIGRITEKLGDFFRRPGVLRSRVPGTEVVEGEADGALRGLDVVAGGELRATFSVADTSGQYDGLPEQVRKLSKFFIPLT